MIFRRTRKQPAEYAFAWEFRGSRDWDRIIAAGEARLPSATEKEFIALPLGVALHQRASRSWARGDLVAALRDAERAIALDPWFLPYRTTRAVLLDALGRRAEAHREIDAFLALVDAHERWRAAVLVWQKSQSPWSVVRDAQAVAREAARCAIPALCDATDEAVNDLIDRVDPSMSEQTGHDRSSADEELGRAHATRGMIALREGLLDQSEGDLRRAMELVPTALHAHCLGAALYARGDIAGAAELEARSVELEPPNARYRWALVMSLRKLGREREARDQAALVLEMEPAVAAHRERFARLFT